MRPRRQHGAWARLRETRNLGENTVHPHITRQRGHDEIRLSQQPKEGNGCMGIATTVSVEKTAYMSEIFDT